MRIEDIDGTRCRPEFVGSILDDLAWLGLEWQTPVRVQSEHFDDYERAVALLDGEGLTYPCFCSRSDIRRATEAPHSGGEQVYPGTCRALEVAERQDRILSGAPYAIRLDMESARARVGTLTWTDRQLGKTTARPGQFGDIVIARKETPASYHLCVTVDDAIQGVELVTRGVDLAECTHVHRLLRALLGLPEPEYWHHPLLTDDKGKKLSKRDGDETLKAMRREGTTASSILNLLAAWL